MVIHSSPGGRRKKKILPKEENKKSTLPVMPEQEVAQIDKVAKEESIIIPIVDDPTAEEFIATLPKKQSRKKVTKIIEE